MALVYQGKLNFLSFAVNEPMVIILPQGKYPGAKAIACWQWTVDGAGRPKQNAKHIGYIDSLDATSDMSFNITMFKQEYYIFSGKISADGITLGLKMAHGDEQSQPITLQQIYSGY